MASAGWQPVCSQSIIQTLNFLNDSDTLLASPLQYNQKYRLKIVNINRNIFKVDDSFTEKSLNATVPAAFSGIKLPASIIKAVPLLNINLANEQLEKATTENGGEVMNVYFSFFRYYK
jgi:hypothetical protein